jgi:hypothetical protein
VPGRWAASQSYWLDDKELQTQSVKSVHHLLLSTTSPETEGIPTDRLLAPNAAQVKNLSESFLEVHLFTLTTEYTAFLNERAGREEISTI